MNEKMKIAVNTGGGDAPGLNAVIRAIVLTAHRKGWDVYGIKYGYRGLEDTSQIIKLTPDVVWHITNIGGTILGSASKGNPFEFPIKKPDGTVVATDISDQIVTNFKRLGFNALIAIGGDGSFRIANRLMKKGIPIIGVPKTIDNDIKKTFITIGFDTAVSTATEAIDKLHITARSHERVMVVEVMGRYAGWIALHSGISGSADVILIPEIPFDIEKVCEKILYLESIGQTHAIVVVAEGAKSKGSDTSFLTPKEIGREPRLGGISQKVADEITKRTGKETRSIILGHIQRGGAPTTFDRMISLVLGTAAVRSIEEGKFGTMVALGQDGVTNIPLDKVVEGIKNVPLNYETVVTARSLGISFGD
jgi:6-phosphofructokinase 1